MLHQYLDELGDDAAKDKQHIHEISHVGDSTDAKLQFKQDLDKLDHKVNQKNRKKQDFFILNAFSDSLIAYI